MTKHLTSLLSVVALSLCVAASAPAALGAEPCPNDTLRDENHSAALPDCRAYELVSPDLNHAEIQTGRGRALPNGEAMVFETFDASSVASSGAAVVNYVRARRDTAKGWSDVTLSPPLLGPVTGYWDFVTNRVSMDLSAIFVITPQPLAGGPQTGVNAFVGGADGTYHLLTPTSVPTKNDAGYLAGNADFSHVYFQSNPLPGVSNSYSWSEENGLRPLGILPDGTPAPNGVGLAGTIIGPTSADANRAAFLSEGKLYLHIEDAPSVEVSGSRRTINPDPNPGPALANVAPFNPTLLAGTNADGSKVLFVAHSELTNDANTGSSGGVATDSGADLYSYDVASGDLTDLTVDTSPADVAIGAGVQTVLGATPDGSYIYFTAIGHLAAGAIPGHASLYVWHDGAIDFVADASDLYRAFSDNPPLLYVTSDGHHAVFASTARLTEYDNTDPVTGQPHNEIFEATYGAGIVCVSCRSDGTRPTADTLLVGADTGNPGILSEDGRRVFFESADAVVPQASNGRQKVFEYSNGKVSLISPADSSSNAFLLAASSSGNDVFYASRDDLVPNPNGGDDVVYDARVDGGFSVNAHGECSGDACRGPLSSAPAFGAPASSSFSGPGNGASRASTATVTPKATRTPAQIRAERLAKALRACKSKHNKKKRSICEKSARKKYGRKK